MKKHINVVGAVIVKDGRVLCTQRGPEGTLPGMWEFPGGKVEDGESPGEALAREIQEELQCDIEVGDKVTTTSHEYDFGIVILTTFYCELVDGVPNPTEHTDMAWVRPHDLDRLKWAPADIPAIEFIAQHFGQR